MTTMSPTQPIRTITPPSSSHDGRGSWDYAVPIDQNENSVMNDSKFYSSSATQTRSNPYPSRQPLLQHTNGMSKTSPTQTDVQESDYVVQSRATNARTKPNDSVNSALESDSSYFDLYKSPSNSSKTQLNDAASRRKPSQASNSSKQAEEDASNWIHRDKLVQIESRELEEAGFRVSRSPSERRENGEGYSRREEKRQRVVSPIRDDEFDEEFYPDADDETIETPKTLQSFIPKPTSSSRPIGGSRIPLPKNSPAPITSSGYGERDSPITRSRNGSGSGSLGSNNYNPQDQQYEQRSRSRSGDSQAIADDAGYATGSGFQTPRRVSSSSDKQASPPKAKLPSKTAPTARKAGTATRNAAPAKSRNGSAQVAKEKEKERERDREREREREKEKEREREREASIAKRPGTSSGRPSTSHRPEGDPPWLASMYKPDPRLPPDQQMLPTHAKRLAQEQWEKEGKTGTIYDREFRLLNTEEFPPQPSNDIIIKASSEATRSPIGQRFNVDREKTTVITTNWPLGHTPPLGSPRSQTSGQRPGTSGTTGTDREHGGYKTMPTISNSQTPSSIPTPVVPFHPIRIADGLDDDMVDQKKGGCMGCACVVM